MHQFSLGLSEATQPLTEKQWAQQLELGNYIHLFIRLCIRKRSGACELVVYSPGSVTESIDLVLGMDPMEDYYFTKSGRLAIEPGPLGSKKVYLGSELLATFQGHTTTLGFKLPNCSGTKLLDFLSVLRRSLENK